jgi:hypothetical protein
MDKFFYFLGGVLTLATIATLVSKNANTANVVSSAGKTLAGVIGAATAPVTGSSAPATFG